MAASGMMTRGTPGEWPETMIVDGKRVNSPYIFMESGHMKCRPCNMWIQSPGHLMSNPGHRSKAWYWCFGCDEPGYKTRPKCPNADWGSRQINERYWRDSPVSDGPAQVQNQGAGGTARAWSKVAAKAAATISARSSSPDGAAGAASGIAQGGAADAAGAESGLAAGVPTIDLAAHDVDDEDFFQGQQNISDMSSYHAKLVNQVIKVDTHVVEIKTSLALLLERGQTEQLDKVQTMEFRHLLATALEEHHELLRKQMEAQESLQTKMDAQMQMQQSLMAQLQETMEKVTKLETVVNSTCARGRPTPQLRQYRKGMSSSASASSLVAPYNHHDKPVSPPGLPREAAQVSAHSS